MGLFDSIGGALKSFNPIMSTLSNVANLATSVMRGDLGGMLNAASQLAITYATGGTGALFSQAASLVTSLASQVVSGGSVGGALGNVVGGHFGGQIGIDGASGMLSEALTGALGLEAGIGAIALIGQQMGLPQSAIDAAQGAFASSMGEHSAAREEYGEAGMYKKGGLFRRTDNVSSSEREQANAFLDMIKGNATQSSQPQFSIGDTLAALIAGPNAGAVQLGQAMGLVAGVNSSMTNLVMAMMTQLLTNQNEEVQQGTGGGQGNRGNAGGAGGNTGTGGTGGAGNTGGTGDAGGAGDTGGTNGSGDTPPTTGNGSVSGSNSILMNIAMALGGVIDEKMNGMDEVATKLGNLGDDDQKGYGTLTAEMTALGQEMKMVQEALNNTLKSIGEAASGLARKQ